MDCCERSGRAKALAAELRAILEWDILDQRPGVVLERHDMDGRVAREMRRGEILAEFYTLRQVAGCGIKELFGGGVCGQPASASVPPKQHSRTPRAMPDARLP